MATAETTRRALGAPAGLKAGVQASVVLLAASALAWLVTQVPQQAWEPAPEVPVEVAGEHYRIAPQELRWLETFSTLHFSEGRDGAIAAVETEIDAHLDRLFADVGSRVPEFLDWYYSLRGEYTRTAMAALEYANLAEPGYVAGQAAAMLLPDDVWAASFDTLETRATATLREHSGDVRQDWIGAVTRRLSAHRVPAPLDAAADADAGFAALRLDPLLQRIDERERDALETRLALSTLAAGGAAAGPALWRAVAARSSAMAGRAAAARTAGRAAARAGTAAAGGAAICSAGGPAAIGCAVIAGAAAWLGTDLALLRVDEHFNRDDLESALAAGLAALREQVEQDLSAAYEGLIDRHYGAVQDEIRRGFVPAHAGEAPAPAAPAAP